MTKRTDAEKQPVDPVEWGRIFEELPVETIDTGTQKRRHAEKKALHVRVLSDADMERESIFLRSELEVMLHGLECLLEYAHPSSRRRRLAISATRKIEAVLARFAKRAGGSS